MTYILGLSAYYHDSAAAILKNGEIVAAAQEERFTRIKGDSSFPAHAVNYCLQTAGITEHEIDHVVFYEHPLTHFERLTSIYHLSAPKSIKSYLQAFPAWLTNKLWTDQIINRELDRKGAVHCCDHHLSHAAAAFYPSPFEDAAIITIDGVGEWSTTTYGYGSGNKFNLLKEMRFPNSVGLLYSAFTYFTGFKINSGEYKLMGLAPYGKPRFVDIILKEIIHLEQDGSIQLNQRYFDYIGGLTMTNANFAELFEGPPRIPESPLTQREMDIAASIQAVLNIIVTKMALHVKEETQAKNLVLAGGVALNVVSSGILSSKQIFDSLWIQPAAGDAGSSLGAALWYWHSVLQQPRNIQKPDSMKGSFLGSDIPPTSTEDDEILKKLGASWIVLPDNELHKKIAELIASENVVGLARGRMEWGPRALGARSILGDARSSKMQSHMNLKIKFRESFRPFAPMVLAEDATSYFEIPEESPYMLFAYPVKEEHRIPLTPEQQKLWGIDLLNVPRSTIPAVTHVDYSARVQTIDKQRNPFVHGVISEFKKITGCSVIINTSFNVRGEPIVNTAEDAYRCFMATDIDYLVIGNRLLYRKEQKGTPLNDEERNKWLRRFDLD
ncbi:carbamoyltransferase family protein [Desulfovibrio litoralis]|uniref:Carbamoyltransferase n=1 Tax=Desulfovibrio litoralis DSM 11393 TaxID=1121455 RepID=A0A1M7S0H2_9BACT|nr:carbamoyltransferase [Desulfovibrio litoralis]SHN52069.1 carbamoyltransferase [Desulfovibrio litoralis DSM 11393]